MKREKIEEIGVRMNKMFVENIKDFQKYSLAKNLSKGIFEKLLR